MQADRHTHTHTRTHTLLRPDVWDRMTRQRSHTWSLKLTRKIKTGCLFDLSDPVHFVEKKKKALLGSLIGHILEAALGLHQYYCAWQVSPPQSKEPPTLTPAPTNPTRKAFCPPLLIKKKKKKRNSSAEQC